MAVNLNDINDEHSPILAEVIETSMWMTITFQDKLNVAVLYKSDIITNFNP